MTAIQKAKVEECNKPYAYANINVYNIVHIIITSQLKKHPPHKCKNKLARKRTKKE